MSDSQAETSSGTCTSNSGGTSAPKPGSSSTSTSSTSSSTSKHHSKMVVEHKFSSSSREMRNMAEKMRRDKLNTYVAEIARIVPLGSGANKRIDKTSVLRLAANYIRMHKVLKEDEEGPSKVPPLFGRDITHSLAEAVGGFLLVVTSSGKVLYITEAVDQFFGHTQVDLLGHSIYNVIHPDDHEIFQQQLVLRDNSRRSFFCRMMEKALSRNDPGRYEIIHVVGQFRPLPQMQSSSCSVTSPTTPTAPSPCETNISSDHDGDESSENEGEMQPLKVANRTGTHMLVSFVRVVKDRPITELSLVESTQDEYITRHGMDGKILYTDHRISFVTGLMPCEVVGTSAFTYMHQEDIVWSIVAQKLMFTSTQGQGIVSYRLKCKNGDLITLRSRGFLEVNKQTGQVESFVCINTVLSLKEAKSEIKNQRRSLLPVIACHETEDHLGSISSSLPPELLNALKQIMNPLTMQNMIDSVKINESALKEELAESEEMMSFDVPSHLFPLPSDEDEATTSKTPDHCQMSHPFQSKPKRPHCEDYESPSEAYARGIKAENDQWLRIAKKRSSVDDFNTVVSKKFTFERDLTLSEANLSCSSSSKSPGQPYSPVASPYSCPSTSSEPENTKSYSLGTCQHYNCNSCGNSATTDIKPKSSLDSHSTGAMQPCNWQQNHPALSPSSVQYDQSATALDFYEQKPTQQLLSPVGYNQNVTSPLPMPMNYDIKGEGFLSPGLGDLQMNDASSPNNDHSQRIYGAPTSPTEHFNQSGIKSLPIFSNITQTRCEVVPSGNNYNVGSYNQSTSHNVCQGMSPLSSYVCGEEKLNLSLVTCNQSDVRKSSSCPVTSRCSYQRSGGSVVSPGDAHMLTTSQNQLSPQYQQVSVCVSHTTSNLSPYPHPFPPQEQNLSIPPQTSTSTSPGHYLPYPPNVQKQTSSHERQQACHPDLGHHSIPVTSSHKLLYGETGITGVPAVPEPNIPEQHSTSEDPLYKDAGSVFSNGHFQHYRSPNHQQGDKLS